MNLFRLADGCLSICGVMLGDDMDEQRNRLIKEGLTSDKWELGKGTILTKQKTGVYTHYLKESSIFLEGQTINSIFFQAEFTSFPYEVADSFLGIAQEVEEYGCQVVEPCWHVLDNKIINQYKVHNALCDVEVNEKISGQGYTIISLDLSANILDNNRKIPEDALGVYKSLSNLARNEWRHRDSHYDNHIIYF